MKSTNFCEAGNPEKYNCKNTEIVASSKFKYLEILHVYIISSTNHTILPSEEICIQNRRHT